MADRFSLPHIDISGRRVVRDYQAPRPNPIAGVPKDRREHGTQLRQQLAAAFVGFDEARPDRPELGPPQGSFIEVELARGKKAEVLERKSDHVVPGATQLLENEAIKVVLYVPNAARGVLDRIIADYTTGPLTEVAQNPPYKGYVESIQEIRQAHFASFWTDDPAALPRDPGAQLWWELWCYPGTEQQVTAMVEQLGGQIAEPHYWLTFPEAHVVPVYTTRSAIELLLFAPFGLLELRRASASPVFFTEENRDDQYDWAVNLAERVTWPDTNVPAVCLFDTGVNRGHVLIEPALSPNDLLAARPAWGGDDHDGHGTKMAGLILHGDLVPRLIDESAYVLTHRMESVKILPPQGFEPNDPRSYGSITQSGVARSEVNNPERNRVYCMAINNEGVSGERSTTWSAAIDQSAAGVMPGDDDEAPKRLFVLSCGNIPPNIERRRIRDPDDYPIEDPSQAWNAITVGGYTAKTEIDEPDLDGWHPYAEVGELSPFSRTSASWPQGKAPFKPDIVMEAGNRAVSPDGVDVLSTDSLSLLTTGADVDRQPLSPFAATSAATAQAARLAIRIAADHPDYWPETIRGLIVHSAEWTPAMRAQIEELNGMRDRYALLRRFGYGVPSYARATASATNHLALVAQMAIQPFKNQNGRRFSDCHFHPLPWPKDVLEGLGGINVRLKVTLSYFIEPNPGVSASVDPYRYQSFGLRFDLRRPLESGPDFVQRINALERENPHERPPGVEEDGHWTFGSQSMSTGSLHCDEWVGPATSLANRDILCVKPIVGWWRDRASLAICHRVARYALVMTLSTEDETVNLYNEVQTIVNTEIGIEVPVRTHPGQ